MLILPPLPPLLLFFSNAFHTLFSLFLNLLTLFLQLLSFLFPLFPFLSLTLGPLLI
jgi:hypothetical protein